MAIQVNGTTVINNSRQLSNIASVDTTTKNAFAAAGVGGVQEGSMTKIGSTLSFGTPVNYSGGNWSTGQSITLPSDFGGGLRNITVKMSFNYSVSYGGFYGGAYMRYRTTNMDSGNYVLLYRTQWSDSIPSSFSGFFSAPMLPQAVHYNDAASTKYTFDSVANFKVIQTSSGTWSGGQQDFVELKNIAAGDTVTFQWANYDNDSRGAGVTSNATSELWVWDRN